MRLRNIHHQDATVDCTEYVLTSVVYYHNNQGSGHYTCHILNDNQCFSINDDTVGLVDNLYIDRMNSLFFQF